MWFIDDTEEVLPPCTNYELQNIYLEKVWGVWNSPCCPLFVIEHDLDNDLAYYQLQAQLSLLSFFLRSNHSTFFFSMYSGVIYMCGVPRDLVLKLQAYQTVPLLRKHVVQLLNREWGNHWCLGRWRVKISVPVLVDYGVKVEKARSVKMDIFSCHDSCQIVIDENR